MKKLLIAFVVALSLAGCAGTRIGDAIGIATTSVKNPVTPAMMYDVENGLRVAVTGLVAYRRLCIAGRADANCRETIAKIQVYTRAAKPILVSLRQYLKVNDQISAITAYEALRDILTGINAARQVTGV